MVVSKKIAEKVSLVRTFLLISHAENIIYNIYYGN